MKAHLMMAQDALAFNMVDTHYKNPIDFQLVDKFEGMEIIRRLIGLAQLPLALNLDEKKELLDYAYEKVVG